MVLSQEEIDGCREAFLAFDKDRSGKFPLSLSLPRYIIIIIIID